MVFPDLTLKKLNMFERLTENVAVGKPLQSEAGVSTKRESSWLPSRTIE